jgi:hypothetical protein
MELSRSASPSLTGGDSHRCIYKWKEVGIMVPVQRFWTGTFQLAGGSELMAKKKAAKKSAKAKKKPAKKKK